MKKMILSLALISTVCFAGKEVDIAGIDKKALLKELFANARPVGMGFVHYKPEHTLTDSEAEEALKLWRVDYLKGRVMKIDLSGDDVDTFLYNRDNGEGVAETVIESLRK